jgi:superfamily II DNA/RNA helicase
MADTRPANTRTNAFTQLGTPAPIVAVLTAKGITAPFPIQSATLPYTLAGRDLLGRGRTGSGKTYAFAIPLVARLAQKPRQSAPRRPRALVLAPTRELASQIEAVIAPLAHAMSLRTTTVFGGVGPGPQIAALRAGVDIIVACPGRLADHVATGAASLDAVEITVIDEADHMADLGFLPAVRKLLDRTPRDGQRMLFSATLDGGVDVLADRYLANPVTKSVDPETSPVAEMAHHVLHIDAADRLPVLVDLTGAPGRTVVFTRTKHRSKTLTRQLVAAGVAAVELHGNLAQNARTRNLKAFADGTARTLVATDIAARGIHIDEVELVIHADPPAEYKAYLHRSGRTARAGAAGTVVTLATPDQAGDVRSLTRQAGITPTTTTLGLGHDLLNHIAPGQRTYRAPDQPTDGRAGLSAGRGAGEPRRRGHVSRSGEAERTGSVARGRATRTATDASGDAGQRGTAAPRRTPLAAPRGIAAFSASARVGRRGR